MAEPDDQLMSCACSDIPEFVAFMQQAWRKDTLMQQTGGGEAFVEAAAPVIRKQLVQALPYASPSSRYIHELRRKGVAPEVLDRALSRAWLDGASEFRVPRPRKRELFYSTGALLAYSVLIVLAGLIGFVNYLRHAHPDIASVVLGAPPVLALCGVPAVVVLFLLLRRFVHRG